MCSARCSVLGHILEKVAGPPLDEQIQDKVLTPMGLTETAAYTTFARRRVD